MVVISCIQQVQKEINEGKKKASHFIVAAPGLSEERKKELFNAWRV